MINTHHHSIQTLTSGAAGRNLGSRAVSMAEGHLYPVWRRTERPRLSSSAVTVRLSELAAIGLARPRPDHAFSLSAGGWRKPVPRHRWSFWLAKRPPLGASGGGVDPRLGMNSFQASRCGDGGPSCPRQPWCRTEDTLSSPTGREARRGKNIIPARPRGDADAMILKIRAGGPCSPFSSGRRLMARDRALAGTRLRCFRIALPISGGRRRKDGRNRFLRRAGRCTVCGTPWIIFGANGGWLDDRKTLGLAHMPCISNADRDCETTGQRAGNGHQPLRSAATRLLASGCLPVCDMEEAGFRIGRRRR